MWVSYVATELSPNSPRPCPGQHAIHAKAEPQNFSLSVFNLNGFDFARKRKPKTKTSPNLHLNASARGEEGGRRGGGECRCHGNSSCIQNTRAGACRGHVWCGLKLPPNSLLDLFFCVQELATELATARANAFIYSHAATANKYK